MNIEYVRHPLATLMQLRHSRFDESNYTVRPEELDDAWDLNEYTVCKGLTLRNMFIRNKSIPGGLLEEVSFAGATLDVCDFTDVEAVGCDFTGCNFQSCVLTGASFSECSLLGAKFDSCYLIDVDFADSFTGPSRNFGYSESKTCGMHICNSILSGISPAQRRFAHVLGNVLTPLHVAGRVFKPGDIKVLHSRLTGNVKPAGSSTAVISDTKRLPLLSGVPTPRYLLGPSGSSCATQPPADKKATLLCSANWPTAP